MHTIIALIGPHSSGKTTIGNILAHFLDWRFDDEIGYKLRIEALAKSENNHADKSPPDFDWTVALAEIERDRKRNYNAVVETWHPGNLSYIQSRNPEQYEFIKCKIQTHLEDYQSHIIIIPLNITVDTLKKRQHELGPSAEYFWNVGKQAHKESQRLELEILEPVQTDSGYTAEECAEQIIARLRRRYKFVTIQDYC